MGRNAFAAKMVATAGRLKAEERKALVQHCIDTVHMASAVALNEQFGFGADRLARFKAATEAVIFEYGDLLDGTDADYANGALERRYKQLTEE